MKVFLDTNVILDFLMKREPFFDDAKTIMALGYNKCYDLYISSLSFSNIAYIARKKFHGENLYKIFEGIREISEVTTIDGRAIDSAIQLRDDDFEDALQYLSAKNNGIDCIVTRNIKDFSFSDIEILTPKDFLSKYI